MGQSWLVCPFLPQLKQRVCDRVFLPPPPPPPPPVLSPRRSWQGQRARSAHAEQCACCPSRAFAVRVCRACVRARAPRRTFFALVQSAQRTLAGKPLAAKAVCSRTVNVNALLQSLHTICSSCSASALRLDMPGAPTGTRSRGLRLQVQGGVNHGTCY